jgi:hypothetical protein
LGVYKLLNFSIFGFLRTESDTNVQKLKKKDTNDQKLLVADFACPEVSIQMHKCEHSTLCSGVDDELDLLNIYQETFAYCPTYCVSGTSNPVRRGLLAIARILTVRERTHGLDEITSHTQVGQSSDGHVPPVHSLILLRQCVQTCAVQSLMTVP